MTGFLTECVPKINPKYTPQYLPTHSHNTRLYPFWIFWALSHSKNFKFLCCLESFIFRFVLNLLKYAFFQSYRLKMPYLSNISNNNVLRPPINIVPKKSNPIPFNVIYSMGVKKNFPWYQIIERLLFQGII